jgi:Ras-related protein Rab-1A
MAAKSDQYIFLVDDEPIQNEMLKDFLSEKFDFKIKTLNINNKIVKLQIWDTNGQERFKAITNSYYRNSHGIIVVFDITDRKSFTGLRNWLNDADRYSENTCKILVGNKSDLQDKREVTYEEAKEFAEAKELIYIEVSAKKTINIDSIFETLSTDLVKNTVNYILSNKKNIPNTNGYISLIEKENIKKNCCKY